MKIFSRNAIVFFMLLYMPATLFSQKEVTRFLGIPVDGSKSEMIEKLKAKGFTSNSIDANLLDGQFNGVNVNIIIATNNNKVRRVAVTDANSSTENNIKIRFNNLLKQFGNNRKYIPTSDSILGKYLIPDDEDISYGLLVKKKSYQAVFYQYTTLYDSITLKVNLLKDKPNLNDIEREQYFSLLKSQLEELYNCFNNKVWLDISRDSVGYYITIYYDNVYNEANGEDL